MSHTSLVVANGEPMVACASHTRVRLLLHHTYRLDHPHRHSRTLQFLLLHRRTSPRYHNLRLQITMESYPEQASSRDGRDVEYFLGALQAGHNVTVLVSSKESWFKVVSWEARDRVATMATIAISKLLLCMATVGAERHMATTAVASHKEVVDRKEVQGCPSCESCIFRPQPVSFVPQFKPFEPLWVFVGFGNHLDRLMELSFMADRTFDQLQYPVAIIDHIIALAERMVNLLQC